MRHHLFGLLLSIVTLLACAPVNFGDICFTEDPDCKPNYFKLSNGEEYYARFGGVFGSIPTLTYNLREDTVTMGPLCSAYEIQHKPEACTTPTFNVVGDTAYIDGKDSRWKRGTLRINRWGYISVNLSESSDPRASLNFTKYYPRWGLEPWKETVPPWRVEL